MKLKTIPGIFILLLLMFNQTTIAQMPNSQEDLMQLVGKTILFRYYTDHSDITTFGVVTAVEEEIIRMTTPREKWQKKIFYEYYGDWLKSSKRDSFNYHTATPPQRPKSLTEIYIVEENQEPVLFFNSMAAYDQFLNMAVGYKDVINQLVGKKVKIQYRPSANRSRLIYRVGTVKRIVGDMIIIKKTEEPWVRALTADYDTFPPYTGHGAALSLMEDVEQIYEVREDKYSRLLWDQCDRDDYLSKESLPSDLNIDLRSEKIDQFKLKTIGKIETAEGWRKNFLGKWVSKGSSIPKLNKKDDRLNQGDDRFSFYLLRKVEYKGQTRLMLRKHSYDKHYKDENSKQGIAYTYNDLYWFFSPEELEEQLNTIKEDQYNLIKLKVIYKKELTGAENVIKRRLEAEPEKYEKADDGGELYIHFRTFRDRNIVQFLIFSIHKDSKGEEYKSGITDLDATSETLLTDKLWDYGYYESTLEDFNVFLPIE